MAVLSNRLWNNEHSTFYSTVPTVLYCPQKRINADTRTTLEHYCTTYIHTVSHNLIQPSIFHCFDFFIRLEVLELFHVRHFFQLLVGRHKFMKRKVLLTWTWSPSFYDSQAIWHHTKKQQLGVAAITPTVAAV